MCRSHNRHVRRIRFVQNNGKAYALNTISTSEYYALHRHLGRYYNITGLVTLDGGPNEMQPNSDGFECCLQSYLWIV